MRRTNCLSFLLAVLVPSSSLIAAQPPAAEPTAFERPPPPGQLIDIGGRRLHILCKGSGIGPTVIFEAGLSQYTAWSTYSKAQDAVATFTQACTYDRAGLGWSDRAPSGRTHQDMVEDLHRLLVTAKLPAPYVLVGHSMGGLLVRLYARSYRGEVYGVVLADASSESIFTPQGAASRVATIAQIDEALKNARPGIPVITLPRETSPDVMMSFTPEILRTVKNEYEAIDRVPAEMKQPRGYGSLDDIPLVVIRRGREHPSAEVEKSWRRSQEELASLSTNSVLIVAEKSGHVIPLDEPDVVADAVHRIYLLPPLNPQCS